MTQESGAKQNESLEEAQRRADRAEQELRKVKRQASDAEGSPGRETKPETRGEVDGGRGAEGEEALRQEPMMAHLMDSLAEGKDIGHYGRLVFTMVALHFMPEERVLEWLSKDSDFDREKAVAMVRQVQARDYNPPRRERILEWQAEQEFPILPDPKDPDCGNVYRSLKFPDEVYEHIQHYQEEKVEAEEAA